jgi:hypothetical protein
MANSGRDFKLSLCNLKNEVSREASFTRYIEEVYGSHAQTQLLAANHTNIMAKSNVDKAKLGNDKMSPTMDMSLLAFGGEIHQDFVQHVDGVFEQAVTTCYCHVVSLTEPIILQQAIVDLVNLFEHHFPNQCTALSILLNYEEHKKQPDCEYLKPFYDRMSFYQFMSMCYVYFHNTFTW